MRRSFGLLGGLLLALALSQFPEYAQQYTQRLGGAVDELKAITVDFDAAAAAAGLSRQQALAHYVDATDTFVAGRGLSMAGAFARYDKLSATLAEIKGADPWERFRNLPSYFDSDVGRRTLDDFKPAVPVTPEGFIYAAIGLVVGYILASTLWALLLLPFHLLWRRWRGRVEA